MQISASSATTAFNALLAQYNGGSLHFYSGLMPAGADTALASSNQILASFSFANPAFSAPTFDVVGYIKAFASFTSGSTTPIASGTVTFAQCVNSGGNVLENRTVGQAWQPSTPVTPGQFMMASASTYMCVASGTTAASGSGPTGNGTNIPDGTAFWKFWNDGSPDIFIPNVQLSPSTPVTIGSFYSAFPLS